MIYRDEDIDLQRCRHKFSQAAIADLKQLGIDWQEGPYYQSQRLHLYRSAMQELIHAERVYPCQYSRKLLENHPNAKKTANGEVVFPKELRPDQTQAIQSFNESINWRFRIPDYGQINFLDRKQGPQSYECQQDFGDFLVWRKDGMPAYELAVVVDDAEMNI